jgi:glucose/mannose transport system substrate-binding protein
MKFRNSANRRDFLKLAAGTAAAAAIAACAVPAATPTTASAPTQAAAPTQAPAAAATATTAPTAAAATATKAPAAAATTAPTAAAATATTAPTAAVTPAAATTPGAFANTYTSPKLSVPAGYKPATGKLEIFSWWTSGGETQALDYLYSDFKALNPAVEVINSAITGGTSSGGNMKAVLQTRMQGGDPPESFQIHLGHELIDNHVVAGRMEALDTLYTDEGYAAVFPPSLIAIASYQGKPYSVPVNIHRANVLWYNLSMFKDIGQDGPPKDWNEFMAVGDKLKAKGVSALGLAENAPGPSAELFESMLQGASSFGPDGYRGLFTGATSWSDPKLLATLNVFVKLIPYFNPDFTSVAWADINKLLENKKVAMMVMGDWTPGVLWSDGFTDFGWGDCPDAPMTYSMLSDSFGLPKIVKNRDAAIAWLKVCGSKHAQEGFNFYKGSIPARTDADLSQYTPYHKWAQKAWTDPKTQIVPSIVHGAAAADAFNVSFQTAINILATKKDAAQAQAALVKAAKTAGYKA